MATEVCEELEDTHSNSIPGIEETKTLICALNLLSRNLPLPSHILHAVTIIYNGGSPVAPDENVDAPVTVRIFFTFVYTFIDFTCIYMCVTETETELIICFFCEVRCGDYLFV